jgi:NADPH-dependent 2,4-dienoyl-CoA reductase/sulfur reductase-like enzyme/rhodanese-related sulfurtransferase
MGKKILIIGGVATGPKTAARCRRLDPDAEITLVERQSILSYAGCGMPFYIEDVIKDWNQLLGGDTIRDVKYFASQKGFKVLDQTEAIRINRETRDVTVNRLESGYTEDLPYDFLVLATGASPIIPRIKGTDLSGVHRLYNPYEAKEIKRAIDEGAKKIAVVGGGLIGMEVCGAFAARGCEVTVFEMMPYLVPNLLDEEMSLLLENYLTSVGVKIMKGSAVSEILDDGNGHVEGVSTRDGTKVEADLVVLAIGVRPNVDLAVNAGLEIGITGAISVNEYLQTNDPYIYAGGDCVENLNIISGEKVYAPLGSTANKHGRVIADNINGFETIFPGVECTTVFKTLNLNCGVTGLTEKKARNLGYDVVTCLTPRYDYSSYIPGAKYIIIKLVADRKTCRVLGCQIIGEGDGVKRIDVIATAIKFGSNLKGIADIDLGYAPPYSTAIDAIAHSANVMRNKIKGIAHGISPLELKKKLESNEDFLLLDIRSRKEHREETFNDERILNIPYDELAARKNEICGGKEIITFCEIGVRAYIAERILRGLGFDRVSFLDGCLRSWPFPSYLTR